MQQEGRRVTEGAQREASRLSGEGPTWVAVMDGRMGSGLGRSHSSSCLVRDGFRVGGELTWGQARSEGSLSTYLENGKCHL
jgi:hypothetical protein